MKISIMTKVTYPYNNFKEINFTISNEIVARQSIGLHNMEKKNDKTNQTKLYKHNTKT